MQRAAIKERVEAVKREGETPLEVLLRIMRTSADEATVIDCAKAAAPFLHRRLAAVEHTGDPQRPVAIVTGVPDVAYADDDTDDRPAHH